MRVKFWGTRGSIPTPGRLTEKYGGNTACVEVSLEGYRLILDGGTGIRELGLTMQAEGPSESAVLFSHLHWDHIQGLPFFVPFFAPGYIFHIYSPPGKRERMNAILNKQMSSEVFPVQFDDLSADIRFERLPDDGGTFGPFHITSFSVNHPGDALAYRIQANDLTVIYATDNELDRENHPDKFDAFVEQVRGADLLIADAQYDARELTTKRGWGHSAYEDVLAMAREAEVRRLAMTHHDPMRDDETLARIERTIRHSNLEMNVFFARDSLAVAVRKS